MSTKLKKNFILQETLCNTENYTKSVIEEKMPNKIKYPKEQENQQFVNSVRNDKCSKQSLLALKSYYHDMTLAFVKDNVLQTLKYTELTQSLSSFLHYLLTNYKNDHENVNQKYVPLREAMKIYTTKYNFNIRDYGNYMILRKEEIDHNFFSDNARYDGDSIDDDIPDCVINYKDILHQTMTATKKFRAKIKNNCYISKQRMIEDLKRSLSVPVNSEKATRMMLSMGWDGGSLGTRGDGIIEPIMPVLDLKAGAGLGHVKQTAGKTNESKSPLIINILEDFLGFLKTDDTDTELIYTRKVTKKDEGFIKNLVNMVNIRRCVEVNDEERGLLLNQIYEVSLLKHFHITGCVVGKSRIKFTKQLISKSDTQGSRANEVSLASNVRHVTLSSPSPVINPGETSTRYATASFLYLINNKYVTPFAPLKINKQNLNYLTFRTATLVFILDFNKSQMDRIEIKFEKVLNAKERSFVDDIVETINKHHNKNGARTKVENHLLKEIWSTTRGADYLVAGFGNCNTSFTLKKVLGKSKSGPKRIKLNNSNLRTDNGSAENDYMNDIFVNIDKAFPPLTWPQSNAIAIYAIPRDRLDDHNDNRDNCNTDSHANERTLSENVQNIAENHKNIKSENLIIVNNIDSGDRNSLNVRKFYLDTDLNGVGPHVSNLCKSCGSLRPDSHQALTVTGNDTNAIINDQSEIINNDDKIPNNYKDSDCDNLSDIDISVWTSSDDDDSDSDELFIDEASPEQDTPKIASPVIAELEEISNKKDTRPVVAREDNAELVIQERVKHMEIKGTEDELHRKKRPRTDSEGSDLTLFKKYKSVDCVTYVNLTRKDQSGAADDVDFVKNVQTVISLMLDITNELPLLKCHGYKNGALVYSCHNEKSLTWLQTHCVTTSDIKITVTEEVFVESIKMSLKINCYIDESYRKIFQRLELYNKSLSTSQWVWLKEEKFSNYIVIMFKIDQLSFNYIKDKNFRLFVGIDEAQFSIVWN